MKTPAFLIIGAMKAGTTTLAHDVGLHPEVHVSPQKEPETLLRFGDNKAAILSDYDSLFRLAKPNQKLGEASTAYTKAPDYIGAPKRARNTCGAALKLLYITRDPVERMISQYNHEKSLGMIKMPLDEALLNVPRYINYSRYDYQLGFWKKQFDEHNIYSFSLDAYISDRTSILKHIWTLLEIDPSFAPLPDEESVLNDARSRLVATGAIKNVVQSHLYQRRIKSMLPNSLRQTAARFLLRTAHQYDDTISPETEKEIRRRLNLNI